MRLWIPTLVVSILSACVPDDGMPEPPPLGAEASAKGHTCATTVSETFDFDDGTLQGWTTYSDGGFSATAAYGGAYISGDSSGCTFHGIQQAFSLASADARIAYDFTAGGAHGLRNALLIQDAATSTTLYHEDASGESGRNDVELSSYLGSTTEINVVTGLYDCWVAYYAHTNLIDNIEVSSCDSDTDGDGDGDSTDCDDADPAIFTGAVELCNGGDDDCDGVTDEDDAADATTWYADADADGFGDLATSTSACAAPTAFVADATDCDDGNASISPAAVEQCDPADVDENCNELADDADGGTAGASTWYIDYDGDGYGSSRYMTESCEFPTGYVADATDCDDTEAAISPAAVELCDTSDTDEDCDGLVDDEDGSATGQSTFFVDGDGDGYGGGTTGEACDLPTGHSTDSTDCDDADASTNPGASELAGTGVDENCNGAEQCYIDADVDGFVDGSGATIESLDVDCTDGGEANASALTGDCNDASAAFHPGAEEADCTDPNDYNCDGSVGYADADLDGWAACAECDDGNAAAYPGAAELVGDEVDGDCDGEEWCFVDNDEDGYSADGYAVMSEDLLCDGAGEAAATAPSGDCDDGNANYNPGALEDDCADPDDYNCDGSSGIVDEDNDAFAACVECNDEDPAVHPDATEVCNGLDDDCDGTIDVGAADAQTWYGDADGDGYTDPDTTVTSCDAPDGYGLASEDDCDDSDPERHPHGNDVPGDGIDQDCDGADVWPATADTGADGRTEGECGCDSTRGTGVSLPLVLGLLALVARRARRSSMRLWIPTLAVSILSACVPDASLPDFAPIGAEAAAKAHSCAITETETFDFDDGTLQGWSTYSSGGFTATAAYGGAYISGDSSGCTFHGIQQSFSLASADARIAYDFSAGGGYWQKNALLIQDSSGATLYHAYASGSSGRNDVELSSYLGSATEINVVTGLYDCWTAYYGHTNLIDNIEVSSCDNDSDGDGDGDSTDCDDTNPAIFTGAVELCNGDDDDCDSVTDEDDAADAATWYADADADGFGDPATVTSACASPSAFVADATDCDDGNSAILPGAPELCNGVDDDCDTVIDEDDATDAATWYADGDGDGFGDPATTVGACSEPTGFVADATDCNDTDSAISPAAEEQCDPADVDEDCDGLSDDDDSSAAGPSTWFIDYDGDGYGSPRYTTEACDLPAGYVADGTDCDDTEAGISPSASEVCDTADTDEDCDGLVDDADASTIGQSTYFADGDADGYGGATTQAACDLPAGHSADSTDCDDASASIFPGAVERCNGADDDCDGVADEDDAVDATIWYADSDGDAYGDAAAGAPACTLPAGFVADATDCDDTDSNANPGATELAGTGVDEDCNGGEQCYIDADADGFVDDSGATIESLDADCADAGEAGAAALTGDCDDAAAAFHPGADEADCSDPNDYNCDGSVGYADADLDGWAACAECDDGNAAAYPGAAELVGDEADGDCDGQEWCFVDADDDGYTADTSTVVSEDLLCDGAGEAPAAAPSGDCDDGSAAYNPGAPEDDCTDPADYNCDGSSSGVDEDQDAFAACQECDDEDAAVHPDATEVCNGLDDDCEGTIDVGAADAQTWYGDADGDGYTDPDTTVTSCDPPDGYGLASEDDCDDSDPERHPHGNDVPGDGIDQDCDGADVPPAPTDSGVSVVRTEGECGCESTQGTGLSEPSVLGLLALVLRRRRRVA